MGRGSGERPGGFTLIELLVVVALIAIVSAIALPSISNYFKVSLNTATRSLASVIKEAYNASVVTGKTHRIVYDLDHALFWVEEGPPTLLLESEESREREKRRKRLFFTEKKEKSPFTLAKKITDKKMTLPRGVKFTSVITEKSKEPATEGTAYTHILPQGFTEKTTLHLEDASQHSITLVLAPFSGNSKLLDGNVAEEALNESAR